MSPSLLIFFAFVAVLGSTRVLYGKPSETCPTWTVYQNNSQMCVCSIVRSDIIICFTDKYNTTEVAVNERFCLTLDKENTTLLLEACPFNVIMGRHIPGYPYLRIPNDPHAIDSVMCGYTKRTGQLCGQCINGYSSPVYSYSPYCVSCPPGTNNWPKYLTVSLLPTTVFFLAVTASRFRATIPIVNGYLIFSQLSTHPLIMRQLAESLFNSHNKGRFASDYFTAIYFTLFGIWNLDFFRLLYTPFCLDPNVSTLQVLSLDYIIAVYPLVLIAITYILVRLHYNNCRLIVWLWRPFIGCFARCRRQWDIQNSLVDAFATFLLLSYVKFLSASCDILTPAKVFDVYGSTKLVLYLDGSVDYFSREHIPFAALAVGALILFTFLPILLLCLYPCQCFHRCLHRHDMNAPALHKLMDSFQGYYKDGTNGTRDYRCFAALFLILRVLINIALMIADVAFSDIIAVIVLAFIFINLLSICQPYKNGLYTKLDIFFLTGINLALSAAWTLHTVASKITDINLYALQISCIVQLAYTVYLVFYYAHKKSKVFRVFVRRAKMLLARERERERTFMLPYRVENI